MALAAAAAGPRLADVQISGYISGRKRESDNGPDRPPSSLPFERVTYANVITMKSSQFQASLR